MFPNNPINQDDEIQYLNIKFQFEIEYGDFVIIATCLGDNSQYLGKVAKIPYILINQIQACLQSRNFVILSKSQSLFKIRVLQMEIALLSKSKIEINELKQFNFQMAEKIQGLLQKSQKNNAQRHQEQIQKLEVYQIKEYIRNLFERQEQLQRRVQQNGEFITNEMNKLRDENKCPQIKYMTNSFIHLSEKQIELQNNIHDQINEMNHQRDEINKFNKQLSNICQTLYKSMKEFSRVTSLVKSDIINLNTNFENEKTQVRLFLENLRNEMIQKINKQISSQINPIKPNRKQPPIFKTNQFQFLGSTIKQNSQSQQVPKYRNTKSFYNQQNTNIPKENVYRSKQKVEIWKWSKNLKSNGIQINGNTVTLKNTEVYFYNQFCLLDVVFSKKLKQKQSWAIKIKKKTGQISLGICLKNEIQKINFNGQKFDWDQTGHGFYIITQQGFCYSHSQKKQDNEDESFKFDVNDVISVEYDPIDMRLRFNKNKKQTFEMSIIAPPQDDEYHPCVQLSDGNSSVELILSQQFSSKNLKKRPQSSGKLDQIQIKNMNKNHFKSRLVSTKQRLAFSYF